MTDKTEQGLAEWILNDGPDYSDYTFRLVVTEWAKLLVPLDPEMDSVPVVQLPGAEPWVASFEAKGPLEERFPDQDAWDFCTMAEYNDHPANLSSGVARLKLIVRRERDERDWTWVVVLNDGTHWEVIAGCDYTGWDCQSWSNWTEIAEMAS